MLTSFCQYQASKNPDSDTNPGHWDIGLLVSGVDFWAADGGGGKSYLTMGLATVTGTISTSYFNIDFTIVTSFDSLWS